MRSFKYMVLIHVLVVKILEKGLGAALHPKMYRA